MVGSLFDRVKKTIEGIEEFKGESGKVLEGVLVASSTGLVAAE